MLGQKVEPSGIFGKAALLGGIDGLGSPSYFAFVNQKVSSTENTGRNARSEKG